MGVYSGGFDIRVTHEFLQHTDIDPVFQHGGGPPKADKLRCAAGYGGDMLFDAGVKSSYISRYPYDFSNNSHAFHVIPF